MAGKYPIWLGDAELFKALKEAAARRGVSLSEAARQAVRIWMATMKPRGDDAPAPEPSRRRAAPRAPDPPRSVQPVIEGPRCRRCSHLASQHWTRGCLATCSCSLERYLAPR